MTHDPTLCMFCLRDDGGFKSREHVVPESLGNKDDVLEPGVVCDRCNNGPLSVCDSALIRCPPVALMKTLRVIKNKKGRLPRAEFSSGIYALDDGEGANVYMRIPEEADLCDDGAGEFELELTASTTERDWSLVSRALLKTGLEMLALKEGKAAVMDSCWDGLREAVLTGGYRGWVVYDTAIEPGYDINLAFPPMNIDGTTRKGLLSRVSAFGVSLSTAWPARGDILSELGRSDAALSLAIRHFERTPSSDSESMTMRATMSYSSRAEWGDDAPVAKKLKDLGLDRD